ncbi:hypothetical protein AM592_22470 [Bacillus gobiensis]|uniref:Uncharacterized protein n=1 Tax=Bacillus gobiensis TaxID=1441095 RepID=A0A0M4G138_9BACI|nr:hypothetical protein AM592_22470 [Bacillus gobiensis]
MIITFKKNPFPAVVFGASTGYLTYTNHYHPDNNHCNNRLRNKGNPVVNLLIQFKQKSIECLAHVKLKFALAFSNYNQTEG